MFTINDIAVATGGNVHGAPKGEVQGISTDSRTTQPGQLFVALRGDRFDGYDFIDQVAERGVRVVLAERSHPLTEADKITVIVVPDTLRALGDLAAAYRRRFHDLPVVGVTGSNGKTTTKEMLAAILEQTGPGLKTAGNLNNLIGLPQMVFQLNDEHRWAILEMGMSEPGEIDRLAEIAAPRTGIVLNAFPAHLESMKNVAGVARAKGELLLRLPTDGCAIVNADDRLIAQQPVRPGARRVTFGLGNANVRATEIVNLGIDGQRFELHLDDQPLTVTLRSYGQHAIYNALAAAAAAHVMGIGRQLIKSGLERFRPYDKRFQLEHCGELILIDDSYNANPASMAAALTTLAELKGAGRAFVALGDMLELGDGEQELHRELGEQAATVADRLYLRGELTAWTAEGALAAGMKATDVVRASVHEEIAADILKHAKPGDLVLVKGSRGMRMDRVAEAIRAAD